VARGQAKLAEHAALLDAVEHKYGVPKNVLVAFWGLETNFGSSMGTLNIPASLATLAWMVAAARSSAASCSTRCRIIDAGHVAAIDMNGSWAGAMGHMQFMPSTFRAYAVDGTAMPVSTSGNRCPMPCIRQRITSGAQAGAPVSRWRLKCNCQRALTGGRHASRIGCQWRNGGSGRAGDGRRPATPSEGRAAIVLPQGWEGPAFMVFDNFDVVMAVESLGELCLERGRNWRTR